MKLYVLSFMLLADHVYTKIAVSKETWAGPRPNHMATKGMNQFPQNNIQNNGKFPIGQHSGGFSNVPNTGGFRKNIARYPNGANVPKFQSGSYPERFKSVANHGRFPNSAKAGGFLTGANQRRFPTSAKLGGSPNGAFRGRVSTGANHGRYLAGANKGSFPTGANQENFPTGANQERFLTGANQERFLTGANQERFLTGANQGQFINDAFAGRIPLGAAFEDDNVNPDFDINVNLDNHKYEINEINAELTPNLMRPSILPINTYSNMNLNGPSFEMDKEYPQSMNGGRGGRMHNPQDEIDDVVEFLAALKESQEPDENIDINSKPLGIPESHLGQSEGQPGDYPEDQHRDNKGFPLFYPGVLPVFYPGGLHQGYPGHYPFGQPADSTGLTGDNPIGQHRGQPGDYSIGQVGGYLGNIPKDYSAEYFVGQMDDYLPVPPTNYIPVPPTDNLFAPHGEFPVEIPEVYPVGQPLDYPDGQPEDDLVNLTGDYPGGHLGDYLRVQPKTYPGGQPESILGHQPLDYQIGLYLQGQLEDYPGEEPGDYHGGQPEDWVGVPNRNNPVNQLKVYPGGQPRDYPVGQPEVYPGKYFGDMVPAGSHDLDMPDPIEDFVDFHGPPSPFLHVDEYMRPMEEQSVLIGDKNVYSDTHEEEDYPSDVVVDSSMFPAHKRDFEDPSEPIILEPIVMDYGDQEETGFVNGRIGQNQYQALKRDFEDSSEPIILEPIVMDYGDLEKTGYMNGRDGDDVIHISEPEVEEVSGYNGAARGYFGAKWKEPKRYSTGWTKSTT